MTTKELAFQKELKALIEKYDAEYHIDYGYYETDSETHTIRLKGHENQSLWLIDDFFPIKKD